ncbi:glycosyltransferase family 1 protein [Mucilaginibacter sp. PAMB04168]|uniref:glycosyltransferase family 4 protein n=1 Tax=Mucilaginibacter sp. PAMB04168 TaxID=3138567 RepID=UPI0031F6897B
MKVLFDHQIFSLQKYGGISRYFANLHRGLQSAGHQSAITALYAENEYVKHDAFLLNNNLGESLWKGKLNKYYKWNRRFSRWSFKTRAFDVFHPTYYDPYFIKYLKKPCVVTVHDMVHELYPEYFPDATEVIARKKLVMERADALIAISEFTKSDIIKVYPQLANKIHVVYHGYLAPDGSTDNLIKENVTLPQNYLLFVGERWHYKNFPLFVKGISPLLQANPQLKLVCAGGKAFTNAELQLFHQQRIGTQCQQMDVTDMLLQQLYRQAKLFAFPSLHEGFGLPLLEAFANQCPVICSNSSCLPEIAGNAAIYFDPLQPADIEQAAAQVLGDENLQQQLKQRGNERLALFTFDACVQNTIKVYQSVL